MDGILVDQNSSDLFLDTTVGQLDRERGGRALHPAGETWPWGR